MGVARLAAVKATYSLNLDASLLEKVCDAAGGHRIHFNRLQRIGDLPHISCTAPLLPCKPGYRIYTDCQSLKNNAVLPLMERFLLPCNSNQFSQPWAPLAAGE
jgi:hypothetical protein